MTPAAAKASHRRLVNGTVTVRKYTGPASSRVAHDTPNCRARITGYLPQELVGAIKQGDQKVILIAEDLEAAGITSLAIGDKIVAHGKELNIEGVDNNTRRVGDTLIAYELQVRG